MSQTIILSTNY